ncbi:hypothetical protein C8Q76DRAFT_717042 [Earliella scabrosa]|nr:hypothetical protein C8Q76DRAFT_717042 [Earliella scabrosa]
MSDHSLGPLPPSGLLNHLSTLLDVTEADGNPTINSGVVSILCGSRAVGFIGMMLDGILYGVLCGQIGYYIRHYTHDRMFLKGSVAAVLVCNTLHSAFYIASFYHNFIVSHNETPTTLPWTSLAQIVINAVSVLIVHCFYAFRIWTISRQRYLVIFLAALIASTIALGTAIFVRIVNASDVDVLQRIMNVQTALSATIVATDICLTVSFSICLVRSREGGAGRSYRLVKGLVFYTVSTGVLTCVCALFALVAMLAYPQSTISTMFYLVGANLYGSAFMANLNARESLRARWNDITDFATIPVTTLAPVPRPPQMTQQDSGMVSVAPASAHCRTLPPCKTTTMAAVPRSQTLDEV